MDQTPVTVNVLVDAQIFRRFALFDARRVKRVWRSPLIFAAILTASALACFALRARAPQADLLGAVLLGVGLGLPAVYYGFFQYSIKKQIARMKLREPRAVYTLTFSPEPGGIAVEYPNASEHFAWNDVFAAYRVPGCVYLYVSAKKAFLLPGEQADECWALFNEILPAGKLRGGGHIHFTQAGRNI